MPVIEEQMRAGMEADDALAEAYQQVDSYRSKYAISQYQYPSDLGSSDLRHYVEFAINVRGKSKLVPESKRLFEVKRDPNSANLSTEDLSSKTLRTTTAAAAGVAAGVAVTGITSQVFKSLNLTGAVSKTVAKGAGVAAGAGVGGAILASDILEADKTYRISDVIALHVDAPPTVRYGMQFSNKELGSLTGVLSGAVFDSQGAVSGSTETLAAFGASVAKLPGAFGGADVGAALSASSKTALNPFKEVIFEAVDFRSFAFKYKFMPKSKDESDAVKRIVDLFKFHMHPELSTGKLFFIYPSEFQITYYYGDSTNEYFHKFRPCVLESMEVTYGGEQFSTFRDGQPTEVNVSLTFRETEILTRNMIGENGSY